MAYAPDIDNPYPKPKPKPTGDNSGGGGNGNNTLSFPAFLPGQLNALAAQLGTFGGTQKQWKNDLRDMTAPMRIGLSTRGNENGNGGRSGGGNGGGKDPRDPVVDDGGFDPSRPRNRSMPMAMAPRGFLQAGQPMNIAPTSGLFAAAAQVPGQMQASAQNQVAPHRQQLPPEIMRFMSQRR